MVEEINIGGGEAHDADSSGRMEPCDVEAQIVSANKSHLLKLEVHY